MKPVTIAVLLFVSSALFSSFVLLQLFNTPATITQTTTAPAGDTAQTSSANLLAPCPEEKQESAKLQSETKKAEAYDIALLSYDCGQTHTVGTFCKDQKVPTSDSYKYCEDLTCGSTSITKPAGAQTRIYSHTKKDCPCGVCIYALTGFTVAESNILHTRAMDGLKCKDNFAPALPPSCAGMGPINLQSVINTGPGNPRVCVFAATSASGSCSTSGSVACPGSIKNAPPCTPTGTTPPTPSPQCLKDIIKKAIENEDCWTV